ncbi:MAG TPA: ferritin-like domain-containing protein [Anaerolineae bacterium]|nr:ferritin-like domain-containing protein [Anaerolineae bacterium]
MEMNSLKELYVEELRDLYSAENQITKALPRMAKKAETEELKGAFEEHLQQTENQIARLEKIFSSLDKSPRGKKCVGMEGLLEEGKEIMTEKMEPEVRDAALIAAAQRVEHYEIAAYGTVRAYAELLGEQEAMQLLTATLEEESATDEKLTQLAESSINVEAMNGQKQKETM